MPAAPALELTWRHSSWLTTRVHPPTSPTLPDVDGDRFSGERAELRGYHWRGRDCDATNPFIYPGRSSRAAASEEVDHDCNGISGVDEGTGESYEEMLCAGTDRRGIAIIGDSATAHFHVPPSWLTAAGWSKDEVFSSASLSLAEDELDMPQW